MCIRMTAYRNLEATVCLVLPDPEKPSPHASPPRCASGDFKVCPLGERRLLQGLDESLEGAYAPEIGD